MAPCISSEIEGLDEACSGFVLDRDLSKKVKEYSSGTTAFCFMQLNKRVEWEGEVLLEKPRMRRL